MPAQPAGAAAQAGAAAVQNFTDFLKAEAARDEAATKHESEIIDDSLKRQSDAIKNQSDAIERIFSVFQWVLGISGALLLAGAAYLGYIVQVASRATKADIEAEVGKQLHAKVTQELQNHAERARASIEKVEKSMATMEANAIKNFGKHGENIAKMFHLTMGTWTQHHLETIYQKKIGRDSDSTFVFHDQENFKNELGFLINKGYLHLDNTSLDKFKEGDNMLDKLIVTDTGKQYLELREKLERPEYQA